MGEVAEVVGGGTPKTDRLEYWEGGAIPWITPADLSGYRGKFISGGARFITQSGLEASAAHLMPKGAVLFSSRAPIGYVAIGANPVSTNQGFKSFVPGPDVSSEYLYYYLQRAKPLAEALSSGTTFPEISTKRAARIPVPVPPLKDQTRLAARIDELFSDLDAGVAALHRAKAKLGRYRAAVLKAAVEGRLAEQWRREHSDEEPPSRLLHRILADRRESWEEEQLARYDATGKKPPKAWRERYTTPVGLATGSLPKLPPTWSWATIDQLAAIKAHAITDGPFGSNLKTAHYQPSGPRVIRLQNIGDGVFVDDRAHISSEHFEHLKKHSVEAGDLIIALLGEDLPRACLVPDWLGNAIVKADCVKFSPHPGSLRPLYASYVLNAQPTRARCAGLIRGVGRPRLNLTRIREIAVPLPPMLEQDQIIQVVEAQLGIADGLLSTLTVTQLGTERLRSAVLGQAFKGRLA